MLNLGIVIVHLINLCYAYFYSLESEHLTKPDSFQFLNTVFHLWSPESVQGDSFISFPEAFEYSFPLLVPKAVQGDSYISFPAAWGASLERSCFWGEHGKNFPLYKG